MGASVADRGVEETAMKKLSTGVCAGSLLAALLTVPLQAQDAKTTVQCWTDKSGQRMCGDRVPPEYAGQQRDVIRDGRVVETKKAAKTAEERAEERRQAKKAEEAQRQADYDRALLETYRSARDIEAMRDERLLLLDSRIASAEKNAGDTDAGLVGLRARVEALEKEDKKVPERLTRQIKEFERAQKENLRALERNRDERADIETKFNKDLARYHALRGTTPPPAPAPAPEGQAAPETPGGTAPAAAPPPPAAGSAPKTDG